jgi:ketosteroid isomerase-like protein
MSGENVETFKRGIEAGSRRDIDALLATLDPEVELHPGMSAALGGDATVFRGYEGVRRWMSGVDEALIEVNIELSEIRDLGDRVVAIGRLRGRGRASGAETEIPIGYVADFKAGKVIRLRTYLDHQEALEAAGQSE